MIILHELILCAQRKSTRSSNYDSTSQKRRDDHDAGESASCRESNQQMQNASDNEKGFLAPALSVRIDAPSLVHPFSSVAATFLD